MPDEFLTVAEIAEHAEAQPTDHPELDRRRRTCRPVPSERRRVRVRQSDLDAFIAAGSTGRPMRSR